MLGLQYAWRVKAQDITGRDYFKNNGYSQVCTFTYGSPYDGLNLNLNLHAQTVSQRQIKVWWDSLANFTSYKLEFRKAGSSGNWFPVTTVNSHVRILDLEPQTNYEFHVQGLSTEFTSQFCSPVNATTQPLPNYQCGELPSFPTNTNFVPLQQANTNMIWQVGQFEMRVMELQNTMSQTGQYSGYGQIKMPFINTIYCSFTNISVSSEQIVVQGKVNALTKGIDQWVNDNGTGTIQEGTAEPEIHTNNVLTPNDIHVNTNNGTVVVAGNTYTYTPAGTTIEDGNGNIFIVTADGQIINAGTIGPGHGPVPDSKNFITTAKGKIIFSGGSKQLYGMDKYTYPALINYYLTVRNLTSNTHDPVDWKSVMAQKYDVIDLSYQLQGNLKADSILFITGTGTIYKPQGSGTSRQLYIVGGKHGDVQELFACYKYGKDSLVNIAKINIVSYRSEQNKVTLVPLGSGITIDKTQMQKALNDIYKQSVATWEVDIAPAITVADTLWDKDGNGRINTGSNLFTRYSSEMRAINKYVRSQTYYNAGQYYLVVTNKPTDSLAAGLLGEMPRGRNIGYLFTSAPTATLVAHELGHGAFVLEHSFEGNATLPKNSSACLMDYNNGTELYKGKYWDYVHSPITVVGAMEDDDDGGMSEDKQHAIINLILNKLKKSCKDDSLIVIMKSLCDNYAVYDIYLDGFHFDKLTLDIKKPQENYIAFHSKNKIKKSIKTYFDYYTQQNLTLHYLLVDNIVEIRVEEDKIDLLKAFLEGSIQGKNLLIFSSGYRPNQTSLVENPKEDDVINFTDTKAYWKGIDAGFINQIGTRNAVYADGHHSVTTSNHKSLNGFLNNLKDWTCASSAIALGFSPILTPISPIKCVALYHSSLLFKLNTQANGTGFMIRRNNGIRAGLDLIDKINNGTIKFDITRDSIDIVCHSFGYAYALGIIDALKVSGQKFKFGRMYCIAPENAGSGAAKWKDFETVWQYGSNDITTPAWEQDGVAPQSAVKDIQTFQSNGVEGGRVYIPDGNSYAHAFLDSHYIDNYWWIFNLKKSDKGYVKARK